jgi:YggT family protein
MGQDPILLIIRTIGELYAFIVVLRFLLQLAKVDFYNPISQAVARLTSTPLRPLQRVIPRAGSVDLSALVLAYGVKLLTLFLLVLAAGQTVPIASLLLFALAGLLNTLLTIAFWAVIGAVIISWIAPNNYHPAPQLILQLTEPLFALARKVIPPIGGLDLSPILIFLAIQIMQSQVSRLVM